MPLVSLRTADFDRSRRVAEFQAVAAHVCKLDIAPRGEADCRSETAIGILPDLVIAGTTHSTCVTTRRSRLAAETGDNVLIHIPEAAASGIRQSGGDEVGCGPGEVYLHPNEVPGVAEFREGLSNVLYISVPRSLLAAATPGLNRTLRRASAMTPQWRLLRDHALGLPGRTARPCCSSTPSARSRATAPCTDSPAGALCIFGPPDGAALAGLAVILPGLAYQTAHRD